MCHLTSYKISLNVSSVVLKSKAAHVALQIAIIVHFSAAILNTVKALQPREKRAHNTTRRNPTVTGRKQKDRIKSSVSFQSEVPEYNFSAFQKQ